MSAPEQAAGPKPRLSDIAAAAGVSTATVSRVLNSKPGVRDSKRNAVLTAIDMLGYERPASLRSRSVGIVGVVVPELTNPIFPIFAQHIEVRLSTFGYTPIVVSQSAGGTTEEQAIELLIAQGVSGIIFVSGLHADTEASGGHYEDLRERGIPIVFVNGARPDISVTQISTDDATAMDVSVKHLADLGHTRVGLLVGPDRFVPSRRKAEAFTEAVSNRLGGPPRPNDIVHSWYTIEGGRAAAEQAIRAGCTALVCGSDQMALGAIQAARGLGLRVPQDVSVIGFDDSPLMAFVDPPLTTVQQPVGAICQAAVSALLGEIDGNPGPRNEMVFRPELILRSSTGAAPTKP